MSACSPAASLGLPECFSRPNRSCRDTNTEVVTSAFLGKEISMQLPSNLKPTLWGAAWGAGLLALAGFTVGGWTTAGTAERTAEHRASTAVIAALAPICVSQFQLAGDTMTKQEELNKVSLYDRGSFVEKAGWATMPGSANAGPGVGKACAELIAKLKL
jgi:hypothetical protein